MTEKDMFYSFGCVDEELLKEAEKYKKETKKYAPAKILIPLAACLTITAVTATVLNNNRSTEEITKGNNGAISETTPAIMPENGTENTTGNLSNGGSNTLSADSTVPAGNTDGNADIHYSGLITETTEGFSAAYTQSAEIDTSASHPQIDESQFGGSDSTGSFFIPCPPLSGTTVIANGARITDEEACAYFSKNKAGLTSALNASGVNTDNMRIAEKGYCHISYTGEANEHYIVRENFRDYLVWSGNKLIAIVTLIKENGVITDSPAFGGPWFDAYNDFLNAHKNEELIYFYANNTELIVTPDNTVYAPVLSPHGYKAADYFEGLGNGLVLPYHESAVYVP